MIFFNEKLVGCVQEFEFKADVHNFRPTIKFVFPDFEGSEKEIKELFEKFSAPIEEFKLISPAFAKMIVEFKKYEVKDHAPKPLDESKLRLLATSSVTVEEIDLSKFDQPKEPTLV